MKLKIKVAALAISAALAACQSSEQSISWVDYGDNPMDNPEFMEQMTSMGTPGDAHAHMAKFVGTWDVAGKWWANPDAEPMPTQGVSTSRMILGGNYLLENYESDFMGQPFEGMMIQGFDNLEQQYFTFWIDSMSTAPMVSYGTRDENGVLNNTGEVYDPRTPAGRPMRTTITDNGTDEVVMNMYDHTMEGEEYLAFQMVYTRR